MQQENTSKIDIADRLISISEEIKGVSEILSSLRELNELTGERASYLLMLHKTIERYSTELSRIANDLTL